MTIEVKDAVKISIIIIIIIYSSQAYKWWSRSNCVKVVNLEYYNEFNSILI